MYRNISDLFLAVAGLGNKAHLSTRSCYQSLVKTRLLQSVTCCGVFIELSKDLPVSYQCVFYVMTHLCFSCVR